MEHHFWCVASTVVHPKAKSHYMCSLCAIMLVAAAAAAATREISMNIKFKKIVSTHSHSLTHSLACSRLQTVIFIVRCAIHHIHGVANQHRHSTRTNRPYIFYTFNFWKWILQKQVIIIILFAHTNKREANLLALDKRCWFTLSHTHTHTVSWQQRTEMNACVHSEWIN